VNANTVYDKSGGEKFRHKVIHGLLEKYAMERKSDPPAHLTERHFPAHIPPTAKNSVPSLSQKKRNEVGM
jgi:hypothetical protein